MKDYIKVNQKAYNALAREYAANKKYYLKLSKRLLQPYISLLKKNPKRPRVLELGPGSGLCTSFLEAEGFETFAIDVSKNIINLAKKLCPNTHFFHKDFLEHDFGKAKYDGILCLAFIHLFKKKDAETVLKKVHNLLAPKGIVYLSTTVEKRSSEGFFEKQGYGTHIKRFRKCWTEKELIESIEGAGFRITKKFRNKEKSFREYKWINFILEK